MKILQIHNYYQFKGGEDSVIEAERRLLVEQGDIVIQLTAHNKRIKHLFSERKVFYQSLKRILETEAIEVAHVHNVYQIIGNEVYGVLAAYRIPIVQTLHNFRFLCPAGLFMDNNHQICEKCSKGAFSNCFLKKCYQNSYSKSLLMQGLVRQGRKAVQAHVSKFIALNPFYRQKYIEAGFNQEQMAIKPNFLFKPSHLPVYQHQQYALFMGRVSPEKGIEDLIDAFKNLHFKLKIVGTGEKDYVKTLQERAKSNSFIEFCGFVDGEEKKILLREASFLVIPSIWYEAFGLVALEAYACGRAVVASNIGGLSTVVKDGETGFLVEASNVIALEEALQKIIDKELFLELGYKGFKYFCEKFTEVQNYQQLNAIYLSAIESNKSKYDDETTTH